MYKTKFTQWGRGLAKYRKSMKSDVERQPSRLMRESTDGSMGTTTGAHPTARHAIVNGMERSLLLSSVGGCVEILLWNMAAYLDWWREKWANAPWLFDNGTRRWTWHMWRGFTLLSFSDPSPAWEALNEACIVAETILIQRRNTLILGVVAVFSNLWRTDFTDIRLNLLRYLTKLAAARLGCQHPLTIVLFHFMNDDVLNQSIGRIIQLLIATLDKGAPLLQQSMCIFDRAYRGRPIDERQCSQAQAPALRHERAVKFDHAENVSMNSAVLRQEGIKYADEAVEDAEQDYWKSIAIAEVRFGHAFPDSVGVEAVSRLARLYLSGGFYTISQRLCLAALENPWTTLPEPDATDIRLALKATLAETLSCQRREYHASTAWNSPPQRDTDHRGSAG